MVTMGTRILTTTTTKLLLQVLWSGLKLQDLDDAIVLEIFLLNWKDFHHHDAWEVVVLSCSGAKEEELKIRPDRVVDKIGDCGASRNDVSAPFALVSDHDLER